MGQSSCGSRAFRSKKHPHTVHRLPVRCSHDRHCSTRTRKDSCATVLHPEETNLATEAAKEAVIAKNDGGVSHPLAAITVIPIAGLLGSADTVQRPRGQTAMSWITLIRSTVTHTCFTRIS